MKFNVAVIGAGLSGLSCARMLSRAGVSVVVFEKSRSLGGRCATRAWRGHVIDHGAQYVTVRNPSFRRELEALAGPDLRKLSAPILDGQDRVIPERSERFYHRMGNNHLGRRLAEGLSVRMETTIDRVFPRKDGWVVAGEAFGAVVSSAPWPQSRNLLGEEAIGNDYAPCLTAFFTYAGPWSKEASPCYARRCDESPLAWSACENHKENRVREDETVFVVQASEAFSAHHLEDDPAAWRKPLQVLLEDRWGLSTRSRLDAFTHRWRYARVLAPPVRPEDPSGFFITGDALTESRVESAWLAGRLTATEVIDWREGLSRSD